MGARLWQGIPFHADESECWDVGDITGPITVVAEDAEGAASAVAAMLLVNAWDVMLEVADAPLVVALEPGVVDWVFVGSFGVEDGRVVPFVGSDTP